jgi:hypothetical protein
MVTGLEHVNPTRISLRYKAWPVLALAAHGTPIESLISPTIALFCDGNDMCEKTSARNRYLKAS